jgi:predicted nucleic acid-binding protein
MNSVFIDTNILVYAASGNTVDQAKVIIARSLLRQRCQLSVQVLNEFLANAIHPKKLGYSRSDALLFVESWQVIHDVHALDLQTFQIAQKWFQSGQLSLWDAWILASAIRSGAEILYSEDFSHLQRYENVVVINPFK